MKAFSQADSAGVCTSLLKSDFLSEFERPPALYRPIAWWMLNGDMESGTVRKQIMLFREYGFGGYATYPYRGLSIPYHGAAWWRFTAEMLETTRDLGLDAWIFDEFNWPSGHCAGYVLRDNPWLRSSVLKHTRLPVGRGGRVLTAIDGEVLSVCFEESSGIAEAQGWTLETTPRKSWLVWKNERETDGILHVITRSPARFTYYFAWGAPWALGPGDAWGNIDLLDERSIRASLRYTQEQYALRFADHLGTTIKGFFTDENVLAMDGIPYTPAIEAEFRARYGRELKDEVRMLFVDEPGSLGLRYDYWRIVSGWIGKRYYQPYRTWCDEHGISLIGHLCGEESLGDNIRLNGDIFEAGRFITHPGVDMLYGVTGYDPPSLWDIPGNHYRTADIRSFHMTMKLAQSTAKHAGAERILNEAFTCEDYAASPASIRRACNYYAAMGTSQLCFADFAYSHAGIRKRRGGGKCFGTPWNRHYPQITEYIGRLSVFAASGSAPSEIGVLYPRTAAWLRHADPDRLRAIDRALYSLLDSLVRAHWPFDFLYEQLLEGAEVSDGAIVLPSETYRVLIVPRCSVLPRASIKTLEQFALQRGRLLIIPPFAEESPDCPDIHETRDRILAQPDVQTWDEAEADRATAIHSLDEALGGWSRKPLEIHGEGADEFVCSHRFIDGRHMFLIANMADGPAAVEIASPIRGRWEQWEMENGKRILLGEGGGPFPLNFSPGEGVMLCAEEGAPRSTTVMHPPIFRELKKIDGPWRFRLAGKNHFRLDPSIRYDEHDRGLTEGWHKPQARGEWRPLARHVCDRDIDRASMPAYWLKASFSADFVPPDLELVVDGDLVTNVFVNGVEQTGFTEALVWDMRNRCFVIAPEVRKGENTVVLRCGTEELRLERINDGPAIPVVLAGSFGVTQSGIAPAADTIKVGPWPERGYPHFAGTGIYETEFMWGEGSEECVLLDLGNVRDTAQVALNGNDLGIRIWPPFRFETGNALVAGRNRLTIEVTSGIGNLMPFGYTDQLVEGPVPYGLLSAPRILLTERRSKG